MYRSDPAGISINYELSCCVSGRDARPVVHGAGANSIEIDFTRDSAASGAPLARAPATPRVRAAGLEGAGFDLCMYQLSYHCRHPSPERDEIVSPDEPHKHREIPYRCLRREITCF